MYSPMLKLFCTGGLMTAHKHKSWNTTHVNVSLIQM